MRYEPLDTCSLPEEREYVNLDTKTLHRFWRKVRKEEKCWKWTGALSDNGYGNFWITPKRCLKASRVSFLIATGYLPPRHLFMCHDCDNPSCVNPGHIFVGTQKDNLQDMASKGRSLLGDKNPSRTQPEKLERGTARYNAKLTNEKVLSIRKLGDAGKTSFSGIGRMFGVSAATISDIVKRKMWKSVPENLNDY